jgi:SAM-dependent methyltransferase
MVLILSANRSSSCRRIGDNQQVAVVGLFNPNSGDVKVIFTIMDNLHQRVEFWDKHHEAKCQGGMPVLVDAYVKYFKDQDVLEIGPGEGRQFEVVYPLSRSYAIADISSKVLDRPIYERAKHHQLTSFKVNLGKSWDVIHCWYVVHHLMLQERVEFFRFIKTHLRPGGLVLFNMPGILAPGEGGEDGMLTTVVTPEEIEVELKREHLEIVEKDSIARIFVCK